MKHRLLSNLFVVLGAVAISTCTLRMNKPVSEPAVSAADRSIAAACSPQLDINVAIRQLASEDWAEAQKTRNVLREYSKESPGCRNEIIEALTNAMTKPNLNFVTDQFTYRLWLHGSMLLGDLKAVEAIDLLIDHLDLNDGFFSSSMVHQPAILGVTGMGVVAVPKLGIALQQSANRNVRLAAAFCLADIGGQEAMGALKQALGSESDTCVSRFIRISIEISNNELKSKARPSKQSDTDAQIDLRRQLLMAFRCDN
jgi:HEAT repeat protein